MLHDRKLGIQLGGLGIMRPMPVHSCVYRLLMSIENLASVYIDKK